MKKFSTKKRAPALVVLALAALAAHSFVSCENLSSDSVRSASVGTDEESVRTLVPDVTPEGVARMLSEIPFGLDQVKEVWSAVNASAANGYDEEYPFGILLRTPGSGVGDEVLHKESDVIWPDPLSVRVFEYAERCLATRASGFMDDLKASGLQIYWPYSENWDGAAMPAIAFSPENGLETGTGLRRVRQSDGTVRVEEFPIDEEYAEKNPVWVVNRNEDSGFLTSEMISMLIPEASLTKSPSSGIRTLKLKEIKAHRNYDSWFSGASEFVVKCGSLENFKAATMDELKDYAPSMTDFIVVVRRKQVEKSVRFNSILVSEWTDQLVSCGFLMIEDDGGTSTTWKCNATVKVKSRSYGVEIEFPLHRSDDNVWRGVLSQNYLEEINGSPVRLGDVSVTFTID